MLEQQLQQCNNGPILPCVSQKERAFLEKHFQKDLKFLRAARQELLQ